MYNVVFLWRGKAHFIDSVELLANSGDLIFDALTKAKGMLESRGIIIPAVVGDNASGVQNVFVWLWSANFPFWKKETVEFFKHGCRQQRCGKHFTGTAFLLAKALSPDADLSVWTAADRNKLNNALTTYCVPLLKKFGHGDDIFVPLKAQVGQWVTRNGPLAITERPLPQPVQYWEGIALHVPILAKVAITIFTVTPSEASVERSFSHQSLLHSDLCANLEDESVRALMSVRMNIPRLLFLPPVVKEEEAEK